MRLSDEKECGSWLNAVLEGRVDWATALTAWLNAECPNDHPDVIPEDEG